MSGRMPPSWLADDQEIRGLLHTVLDRFDHRPGVERSKPLFLKAEQHLPSLRHGDATAEQTWALVEELISLKVCDLKTPRRRGEFDFPWTGAKLTFEPTIESLLREWLGRAFVEPAMQRWRQAVAAHAHNFPGDTQMLLARRIAIDGRTDEEVLAALARIGSMPDRMSLRQLSATLFWGDSKVLDERRELVAALFPNYQVRDRPIVIAVHLPAVSRGVLFIENQDSYAQAACTLPEAVDLTLVYSAGFRSAAARIRSRAGSLLHFAGSGIDAMRTEFEQWWYGESATSMATAFWGDLDFAGMQILKSLRERFGDVRAWRPGYEPMLAALQARLARGADDRGQIDPGITGCSYADEILGSSGKSVGRFV